MKSLEKILVLTVSILLILYAAVVLLFSLPLMQNKLAGWTADVLSKQIHSKIEIGSINLGLLNRVIVNDVVVYEPSGKQMASIARVSANINPSLLVAGKISIGTAQLFGVKAQLYRQTPDSQPNYQFLIDAFQSDNKDEPTEIDISVGSFLMRHANISYNVLSAERREGRIDFNHLTFSDGGMNLVLKCLTNDSLNVSIRHLHMKEQNSGLVISNAQLHLTGNKECATLSDFSLSLPHSAIHTDTLTIGYGDLGNHNKIHFSSTPISGHITPSDLQAVNANLATVTSPIHFNITALGDEKDAEVGITLDTENGDMKLSAIANVSNMLENKARHIHATISSLQMKSAYIQEWVSAFDSGHSADSIIAATKTINYHGTVEKEANGTISSEGIVSTGIGRAKYNMALYTDGLLAGTIDGDSIDIGKLLNDATFGTSSFSLDIATNFSNKEEIPTGRVAGKVYNVNYNEYNYHNIEIDATSTSAQIDGMVSIDDDNLRLNTNFVYNNAQTKGIKMQTLLEHINPHRLHLTSEHAGETLSLDADVDLAGVDFSHLFGYVKITDIRLKTPSEQFKINNIDITAEQLGERQNSYTINSDIINGHIEGNTTVTDIANAVTNQLALHLHSVFKPKSIADGDFTYNFTVTDISLVNYIANTDFTINSPIHIEGYLNSAQNQMAMQLSAPKLSYDGKNYDGVSLECYATNDNMNVKASAHSLNMWDIYNDIPPTNTNVNVVADIHDNSIDGNLSLDIQGANNISLSLRPTIMLKDSLNNLKTVIVLHRSEAVINDTTWTVAPSYISLYKDNIKFSGVKFANNTNSSLTIDGRVSSSPSDSIVAKLNNLEIKYFLPLVDFDAVRFAGRASGVVTAKRLFGNNIPDLKANLQVADLSVQEGIIGDADIQAKWDKTVDGISVDGRIIDLYQVPDALTGNDKNVAGITTVNGWISPAKNDIRLDINTLNTNASFIQGFLGGVFNEVSGYVSGPISVVGPLNNINIVGYAVPNINLRLRATDVPYHAEGDTILLQPYLFDFPNISLYDRFGNRSTVTGQVTHRNLKNFAYTFDAVLHETLVYDETQFNIDKFLATVFADGNISIEGRDGHPLYVNASVTPTQGSVFAYDAATPDAITGNSFIEYHDRDSLTTIIASPYFEASNTEAQDDSLAIINEAKKNYDSDIFINFDIDLTPACEVKLRMNNAEDGYIQTFGNAKLTAQWYNKGSFQLFGKYDIEGGDYRLYLQDIIFRDLALQPGSSVEFNGNPFNANIHLICHHTINSVPLSDLTSTTAFSQNNKVKVVCILDITGKLGNMDFKFGMDMPNVSEEAKQLVNSIINSEEEMNTQMIYLLGFGRFYPSEYARANGNNSNQAVNSLLSSTLSGQLNQLLSNVIGNNSNWNFGSSLTTGEQGWNDLDVEGNLSGRLLNERLLIDGNFGYRDNALTQRANFIGDFEIKWRMTPTGNRYVKAYNQTNDRYFTKATLNTQGIGLSWQHDFEIIRQRMKKKEEKERTKKSTQ